MERNSFLRKKNQPAATQYSSMDPGYSDWLICRSYMYRLPESLAITPKSSSPKGNRGLPHSLCGKEMAFLSRHTTLVTICRGWDKEEPSLRLPSLVLNGQFRMCSDRHWNKQLCSHQSLLHYHSVSTATRHLKTHNKNNIYCFNYNSMQ